MLPMETQKPYEEYFKYIDIDAIDNKHNVISNPKIILSSKAPSRARRKIYSRSTLFSMVRPYLRNIAYVGKENENAIASTGFYVCTPIEPIEAKYFFLLLSSDYIVNKLNFFMKGDNSPSINTENIENMYFPIPSVNYQKLCISIIDKIWPIIDKIQSDYDDIIEHSESLKKKILTEIFEKNDSDNSYYEKYFLLGDILKYEQPGPYIVNSTEYSDNYKTPVLTPGKTFVLGYTNESDGIYKVKNKVIIFDDFTTASRIVNFDFKVKSSAMKILHSIDENKFDIDYLYYYLQTVNVLNSSHKRYWISEYSNIKIKVHKYDEQLKIVSIINKIFTIIDSIL